MKEENGMTEKPIFIPPRKRGAKSSPRSNSNHQLVAAVTPIHLKQSPKEGNNCIIRSLSASPEQSNCQRRTTSAPKPKKNCSFAPPEILLEEPYTEKTQFKFTLSDTGSAELDLTTEHSALNAASAKVHGNERYLTMTGTVKRGKKKGQTMDMKVNISREELDEIEGTIRAQRKAEEDDSCFFGLHKGPHVLVLSLVCFPFVFLFASGYSFYMGTMTWYNVLVLYSEKKTVLHKILVSPLLIVIYPFLILLCTFGLGAFAAGIQISWNYDKWKQEVVDWEKGFYGWLCSILGLEDCAPYEVVILTEIQPDPQQTKKAQVADSTV